MIGSSEEVTEEELFRRYYYLVEVTRLKLRLTRDIEELQAIGRLALWTSIQRYDPSYGISFRNYALRLIRWEMCRHIHQETRHLKRRADVRELDRLTTADFADRLLERLWRRDLVRSLLAVADQREEAVIRLWVIAGWRLSDIGTVFGVSAQSAGQIVRKAVRRWKETASLPVGVE